jgi:hypothetical protein
VVAIVIVKTVEMALKFWYAMLRNSQEIEEVKELVDGVRRKVFGQWDQKSSCSSAKDDSKCCAIWLKGIRYAGR